MAWTKAHVHAKRHLDPSIRLATMTRAENWGVGLCPLFREGELGPHLTQSRLVEANLHTKCHLDAYNRLDTTEMGQKLGRGSAPFLGKADESPSSTTWPGIRPISEKSAHLTARPKPHCLRWGPSSPPPKGRSPQFLAHICCGQMAG